MLKCIGTSLFTGTIGVHGLPLLTMRVLARNSATEEATPSSVFVENGSATWFSAILGGVLRLIFFLSTNVSMVTKKSSSKYVLPLHTQSRFQVHLDYTYELLCEANNLIIPATFSFNITAMIIHLYFLSTWRLTNVAFSCH